MRLLSIVICYGVCNNYLCLFSRAALSKQDKEILDDIHEATKCISKSSVETTAYLRALSNSKGLDVKKFCQEVQDELQEEKSKMPSTFKFHLLVSEYVLSPSDVCRITVSANCGCVLDQEFVPLPDLNNRTDDDFYYGGDSTLWTYDDSTTSSESGVRPSSPTDDLVRDETPFYANQEEDP